MIQSRDFEFLDDDVLFRATVRYNDSQFRDAYRRGEEIFYSIYLHEPVEIDCGTEYVGRGGKVMTSMLMQTKFGDKYYIFDPNPKNNHDENSTNLYNEVVSKIISRYKKMASKKPQYLDADLRKEADDT